jgi:hypothetical protein
MSIQNIIDKAQQIEIDRRRMISQSISRSQRVKTAERSTTQPWKFKITPPGSLPWTASRGFMEVIDTQDRVTEYEISLSNSPGMSYITAYQGPLTQAQLDALAISTSTTSTLTIGTLPSIGAELANTGTYVASDTVIFAAGDFVQPEDSRYPYTVTETVLRGSGSTISITLNRGILTSENLYLPGKNLTVGNSCTWRVIVTGLPSYQLIPMQRVQYTGDFELIEKVI